MRVFRCVAALLLLHVFACVPDLVLAPRVASVAALSADLAIALAFAICGAAAGRPRIAAHAAALLLFVAVAYRSLVLHWPLYMDSPFGPADLPQLAGLPHLLLDHLPAWLHWAAPIGLLAVLIALHVACARAFACLGRVGASRLIAVVALQALVVLGVSWRAAVPGATPLWRDSAVVAIGIDLATELRTRMLPTAAESGPLAEAARIAAAPADLRGLDGADVHVLFLESYGRVALRHPETAAHLRGLWPEFEKALAAAGFTALSGAIAPAISGGGSPLAHAELFAGIRVPDQRTEDRLLASSTRTLPRLFADAGYHTVEVLPAMPENWRTGMDFFGFEQGLSQQELGYQGFRYHFGCMPDQFALQRLLRTVIEPAPPERPLFTFFVSVTSHLPCTHIPPYVPDWNFDPATYPDQPDHSFATSWFNVRTSPDTPHAYRDAIEYALRTAVGFTCHLTRPSLVIVLGDHQPPVKSVLVPDDTSADVPVHVICNRPELLAKFAAFGLSPGLDVPDAATSFESASFAPRFLELFSRR